MPKRKSKYFKFFSKYRALIVAVTLVIFGGWFAYSSLLNPLGINEVRNPEIQTLIREDYNREGILCAQVYGNCLSYDNKCITYTDSCMQAKLCSQPYKSCIDPVPTRSPIVKTPAPNLQPPANCTSWFDGCNTCQIKDGVIGICTKMACKDTTQAPKCLAYSGQTPTPTPVATSIPQANGIVNFQAANPCGPSGFYNYSVYCVSGLRKDISTGTCTPLSVALSNAESLCQSK